MYRRQLVFIIIAITIILSSFSIYTKRKNDDDWRPKNGFVPNEEVAREIAETILLPIYGADIIIPQKPFDVYLVGDSLWVITGKPDTTVLGGTVYVEIDKRSCCIYKVTHGK